jgi:hypothetical protein
MQWSATDQFGNLYIGESDATTPDQLRPHLASLLEELRERASGPVVVSIDMDYTEISGPTPDHVSHILRAPNLSCFHSGQSPEEIRSEVEGIVKEIGGGDVEVRLA